MKNQARSSDLNVRANVAKAFSQSLGTRRPQDGVTILKMLAADRRLRVRQAVPAAARNITKKSELGKALVARRLWRLLDV